MIFVWYILKYSTYASIEKSIVVPWLACHFWICSEEHKVTGKIISAN